MTAKKISPAAQEDIIELAAKIRKFKNGTIDEERFKHFRLTRGVYGQRQPGVQMFRTKLPLGIITANQLRVIADVADEFTNGHLHLTTRQNIQMHFIKLEDTPAIWKRLESAGITAREACGNTVRNITASPMAGIDPQEPFDVTPYANAVFEYFLRNPVCQEMGRKIKIAFSSSEQDTALTFLHDFGFIPRTRLNNNKEEKGFKVVVGGGLGAQAMYAHAVDEFLPTHQLIPFIEAGLRVFDRYGEREKRFKARLKFLVNEKGGLGIDKFMQLLRKEQAVLGPQHVTINYEDQPQIANHSLVEEKIDNNEAFDFWKKTNVMPQKQKGYFAVKVRVPLGNLTSDIARSLSQLAKKYAADHLRITIHQGILLRYVSATSLPSVYHSLRQISLHYAGADRISDVTACPGTDTCNLGVTNSTGVALEIEKLIYQEFKELIVTDDIKIKISGCMNACGQHMIANIGFHGSSIKHGEQVVPALQVVLGGGFDEDGNGRMADKVIKLPSKRILQAIRLILNDYTTNSHSKDNFNSYYKQHGKRYFYDLLKPLADTTNLVTSDFVDWGHQEAFIPEIGTGECAGASVDVVSTIITDAEERLYFAEKALKVGAFPDAIYHCYSALVIGAKALLLSADIHCNTHIGIIKDFDTHFVKPGIFSWKEDFEHQTLKMKGKPANKTFAKAYFSESLEFIQSIKKYREQQLKEESSQRGKKVINHFYKA